MKKLRFFFNGRELRHNDIIKTGDKIIVIDTEAYRSRVFSQNEELWLVQGCHILSGFDRLVFESNREHFWERFVRYSNLGTSLFAQIREAAGLSMNILEQLQNNRIFIPSERALNSISVHYRPDSDEAFVKKIPHILSEIPHFQTLKAITLYANFLGARIDKIIITSTRRTIEQQADIMIEEYFKKQLPMYGPAKQEYEAAKEQAAGPFAEAYARSVVMDYIKRKQHLFYHVSDKEVCDVSPSFINPYQEYFSQSMRIFRQNGYISKESIILGEKGEKAYHFVWD